MHIFEMKLLPDSFKIMNTKFDFCGFITLLFPETAKYPDRLLTLICNSLFMERHFLDG